MKPLTIVCAWALGSCLMFASPIVLAQPAQSTMPAASATAAPMLHANLRALLHGEIVPLRNYALAVHAGDTAKAKEAVDATDAAGERVGNAVARFYGQTAGKQFTKLVGEHSKGVEALTDATHSGDKAGEQKAMQQLAANGSEISKFLSSANPNLPYEKVKSLWVQHVHDHKIQIDEIMSNAPKAQQQKSWDEMQMHVKTIADSLAGAIAKQFPNKAS